MAWDGNGQFSRTNGTQTGSTTWANARDAGNNITAAQHDTHDQDLADGINACLAKNGENGATGAIKPATDDATDLGSTTKRWRRVYISGYIGDANGNELLKVSAVASAVNELTATNAATGKRPVLSATGGDTDIDLQLEGKGAGAVVAPLASAGCALMGGYLAWSVSGNVLTVAIKTWAGNDPSATEPVWVGFRSSTADTGSLIWRKLTAATSIAINDTALLGTVNSIAFRLWAVAFDDGGTVRVAVINCVTTAAGAGAGRDVTSIYPLAGWGIASATQEDNASDSAGVFYSSGASVTSKAYATLGYATWESGLGTAGTWSSGPTRVLLFGPGVPLPGQTIQVVRNDTGAVATGTTQTPNDDTIPQNTEGDQYMSQAITPSSAANVLDIDHRGQYVGSSINQIIVALHQDTTANALAAAAGGNNANANYMMPQAIAKKILAATTASTTFKIRAGLDGANTLTFNGSSGGRKFGGVSISYLQVAEVMG